MPGNFRSQEKFHKKMKIFDHWSFFSSSWASFSGPGKIDISRSRQRKVLSSQIRLAKGKMGAPRL